MAQACVLILIWKSIVLVVEYGDSSLSKLSKSPGARCIGAFSCCFLKIISKMFDGSREKYYLCRRNDDIELRLCAD